jgi:membrane-bound serine protease (ClpP class)
MLGLVVELWNPGAVFPGVVGGICLLLAFFAFQVLPVNAAGILLIVLGIGLLVLEATVPSFGVLGIGGIISLVVGAVMVTREVPGVRVNYEFIVPVAIATGGVALFLGRLAMRAQAQKAVTGAEGLIGERGQALTALEADGFGQVSVHGEIWRACSSNPIAAGSRVRVTALDGLTLTVEADRFQPAAISAES